MHQVPDPAGAPEPATTAPTGALAAGAPPADAAPLADALAGAAALAVAMGIGRFAFTPMLPLMVREGQLALSASAWLAAANYLGYLAGALSLRHLPWSPALAARFSLAGIVLTTAAMGVVGSLPAWLALRGLAGLFSGWALVGVSAWVLQVLAHAGRPQLAALVYAGVGSGIAVAGLACLWGAGPAVPAARLWLGLALLALVGALLPLLRLRGGPPPLPTGAAAGVRAGDGERVLVLCYGLFGFGYILPATYLPALARQLIDDPARFGLVWPAFGAAAAVSTLFAAQRWIQARRLRAWSVCQLLMAVGAALPALHLAVPTLVASALLIGGTFMVITMLGMQEARQRAPGQAAAALGRMTAAFASGQLAGPLALGLMPPGSLRLALAAAAAGLVFSAAPLWRMAKHAGSAP